MRMRTNQKALMFFVLGMITKVTQTLYFSIIPEMSIVNSPMNVGTCSSIE